MDNRLILSVMVATLACAGGERPGADSSGAVDSAPAGVVPDSGATPVTPAPPPAAQTPAAPASGARTDSSREIKPPITRPPIAPARPGPPAAGTGATNDSLQLVRLEERARALIRAGGCANPSDCRAAPVGNRACGGPRTYFVYCRATTDSVALSRVLVELARAERAYNTKQGLASTCEFREPPAMEVAGGRCRAQ